MGSGWGKIERVEHGILAPQSVHGDTLLGDDIVITMLQHVISVVFHDVSVVDVEVSEHFIGVPETDEGDDLRVNACIKQGIGSGGRKTAC